MKIPINIITWNIICWVNIWRMSLCRVLPSYIFFQGISWQFDGGVEEKFTQWWGTFSFRGLFICLYFFLVPVSHSTISYLAISVSMTLEALSHQKREIYLLFRGLVLFGHQIYISYVSAFIKQILQNISFSTEYPR